MTTSAPIRRVADQLAAGEARLLVAEVEDLDGLLAGLFAAARGVAALDQVVAVHERLRPVHGAEADAEQAERDAEAEEAGC